MNEQKHMTERVTFGFWVYLMSDCVLFASLFATYAVLHTASFGAPPAKELFTLPFVLGETLILLTSSFTVGLALLAARAHTRGLALAALLTTLLLGAAFLTMEVIEFTELIAAGHGPATAASLSSFFALVGTHGLHVALGSLWMVVVMAHIALRGFAEGALRKLACLGLFWHFLDIIWIFIFTFVYLFGFISL